MLNKVPHHEDDMRKWRLDPHILNLSTRWNVTI